MLFSLLLLRLATCDESNELGIKIETLAKEIEELSRSVEKLKKLFYGIQKGVPNLKQYQDAFRKRSAIAGKPSSRPEIGNSSVTINNERVFRKYVRPSLKSIQRRLINENKLNKSTVSLPPSPDGNSSIFT